MGRRHGNARKGLADVTERDDAALISRDALVPGLAFCLDGDLVAETLARARPDLGVTGATVTYVRYKPGTACVAAHRIRTTRDGDLLACSRAVSPSGQAKLKGLERVAERVGRHDDVVMVERFDAALALFPIDLRLSTAGLVHNAVETRVLGDLGCGLGPPAEHSQKPLRYKPERRYAARLSDGKGPVGVAKWYPTGGRRTFARALAAGRALRTIEQVGAPRELGHSRRHRVIVLAWEPGETLGERLALGTASAGDLGAAGALLRMVHAAPPERLAGLEQPSAIAGARHATAAIASLAPQLATPALHLARKIVPCLRVGTCAVRPGHGDFSADQLVSNRGRWSLLDPDSAGLADPAADVGDFLAHLTSSELRASVPSSTSDLAPAFAEGYEPVDDASFGRRVEAYAALGLLRRACEPFRERDASWRELVEAHLRSAELALQGRREL